MSSRVETNTADTVMDGRVVTVRPVHLQSVTMGNTGRVILTWLFHPNPEGVLRVQVKHPMVLDIDLRNSVIGCG